MGTSIIETNHETNGFGFSTTESNFNQVHSTNQRIPFFKRFLRTTFRNCIGFLTLFFVLMALGISLLAIWPRSYRSTALLTVDSSRLDHMSIIGKTQNVQKLHEEEVNSVLAMLNSRKMQELVVDRLGDSKALVEEQPWSLGRGVKNLMGGAKELASKCFGLHEDYSDREYAINKLIKNVEIKSKRRSSIIEVLAISDSPESAQEVASTYVEEFIAFHSRLHTSDKKIAFHRTEVESLSENVRSLDKQITDFKNENAMLDFAGDRSQLLQSLGKMKAAILENEQQIESSRVGLEILKSEFELIPETVTQSRTTNATSGTARDRMREKLYLLEIDANEATSRYTDSHPKSLAIKRQLEEARKVFSEQDGTNDSETKAMNPFKLQTEAVVLQKETALRGLESKGKLLTEQVKRLEKKSIIFNLRENQLNALQRERETVETNLQLAIARLEKERVFEGMKQEENAAIIVAQPASRIERVYSPSKRMGFLGVTLLSLFSVGSLALFLSKMDDKICIEEDVNFVLGVDVVSQVPTKRQMGDLFSLEDLSRISRRLGLETDEQFFLALVHVGGQHSTLDGDLVSAFSNLLWRKVLHFDLDRSPESTSIETSDNTQLACLTPSVDVDNVARICGKNHLKSVWKQTSDLHDLFADFDLICLSAGQLDSAGLRSSIASKSDSTLVIVESGTDMSDLRDSIERLGSIGANIGGVILVNPNDPVPSWLKRLVG